MATQCRSSKCTAERKGFRRELDSWRHKLIHCVGFESILEGIYGTRLLRDLSIFDDCEPDVVNDWSVDASCSFCSLQLEKIGDHIPAVCSLQSTPTEESSQGKSNTEKIEYQADKFLHAIFRKKDLPQSCDPNIPLVAQELMKRMIRQFAIEYASKSQIQGGKNGSSLDTNLVCDSQHPSDQDGPLDLTVNRTHLNVEQAGGVLDLSQKNRSSSTLSICTNASTNQNTSGRPQKDDFVERSSEFSEGLLSKALKDIQSGSLDIHKAAILYGIPQKTLLLQLDALSEGKLSVLENFSQDNGTDLFVSRSRETRLVLRRVASRVRAEVELSQPGKFGMTENSELKLPAASSYLHHLTLQKMFSQLKEKNESLCFQSLNGPAVHLKIPQVRASAVPKSQADISSFVDVMYQVSKGAPVPDGLSLQKLKTILPKQNKMECSVPLNSGIESCLMQADLSPLCLNLKNGSVEDAEDLDRREKQPRKKRGRYRQYDHDILEEAIAMVMSGKMSVSKAQGVYRVPHSTLEYKVKERSGTLKTPPKKKPRLSESVTDSGTNTSRRF